MYVEKIDQTQSCSHGNDKHDIHLDPVGVVRKYCFSFYSFAFQFGGFEYCFLGLTSSISRPSRERHADALSTIKPYSAFAGKAQVRGRLHALVSRFYSERVDWLVSTSR